MPNGRCKTHGGRSPGASRGQHNGNWKGGFHSQEAKADRRRLREKVDFVTSPGYGYPGEHGSVGTAWRKRVGLPRGGPAALITTLAVFTFDRENGEAMLQSYHPGTTIEQVQQQTGWKLRLAPDCAETVPPSAEELRVIRECDPQGKWTR